MDTIKKTEKFVTPTYSRLPITVTNGKGYYLYDEDGKEYIDFTAGIGVNSLGYQHPEWVAKTQEQLSNLQHISNLYYTKPAAEVAEKLVERTNLNHVIFVNSGAESNEVAIKVARKWGHQQNPKKHKILTLKNSFHGRTITTLSATGQDSFHQYFDPFTEGFDYVVANDMDDLEDKIDEEICAIMIEVIQGEGGVVPLDKSFLDKIEEITSSDKDILLLIDEVQTGIGRTGKLFAYQHFGLTPDIVTSAKGLGNGLPIGAAIFGDKVKDVLGAGDHGSTFGGNPVATSGANVVLETIDENMLQEINAKSDALIKGLNTIDGVKKVSGLGLMLGIEFEEADAKEVMKEAVEKGILFLTAKDKLRLLPPLTIDQQAIDKAIEILQEILNKET